MALLAMAIFDTPENRRSDLTRRTLESLVKTVDFTRHRIFLVVNAATAETTDAIVAFCQTVGNAAEVIYCRENIGTARAINKAWAHRVAGENAIKMDNDVVFGRASDGWVDTLEECIIREPSIGIIGLKRKDLDEGRETNSPQFASKIVRLHAPKGHRWIDVEVVAHVMGTCQMYSSALLDAIGYLCQPGLYGYDDSLAAIRCTKAGFISCFYPAIEIDHIDPPDVGLSDFTKWKSAHANGDHPDNVAYQRMKAGYHAGTLSIIYDVHGQPVPMGPATGPAYTWRVPNLSTR